jgi:Skp family chaperone for outer membrane proteins
MQYKKKKENPLTPEEIKEKYKDVQEEMQEVLSWVKEEEDKLEEDKFKTHQARSACKRNLVKAKRRVDSVSGMINYWKNRMNGMSHFKASIELNEYWASLKNSAK